MTNWDKFTPQARRALVIAQEEARRLGHARIGPEHLLLALSQEEQGGAAKALKNLGVAPHQVQNVVEALVGYGTRGGVGRLALSPELERVLALAAEEAKRRGHPQIDTEHLLIALAGLGSSTALTVLSRLHVSPEQVRTAANQVIHEAQIQRERERSRKETPLLDQLAKDLTDEAACGKLDPVIGRQQEIERVVQILLRRTKNNPALLGEPGVGKTAIVEAVAQKLATGDVPAQLRNKKLWQLDVGSLVAGTMYRGQFEERMKRVIEEIKTSGGILFIDEMHMLVGAGSAGSAVDAANILKPALSRGEFQVIGATTMGEYRKYIESDAALERRFQPVKVDEPTIPETIEILKGLRPIYETHHHLTITDEALERAATLSARYISDRFLPDKAIDLMDEAAARVRIRSEAAILNQKKALPAPSPQRGLGQWWSDMETRSKVIEEGPTWATASAAQQLTVTGEDIAEVAAAWTGVPVVQLLSQEVERLKKLEEALHQRIVGQDEAIAALAKAVRRSRVGLKDPKRPQGAFMFLGPTGVGKTELAKALAEFLFGTEQALIKLDMSEYMEYHTVSRMIGSPPGYVGYDEGGQLTEMIRRRPYSVVLFDEMEKAHPEVFNILLQIMEDGRLTDGHGRKVDFRNAVVIMTANVGTHRLRPQDSLGFAVQRDQQRAALEEYEKMKEKVMEELKKTFRPEFLNRVDGVVVFHALSPEQLRQIVDIKLRELQKRLDEKKLVLQVSDTAKDFLAKEGYDPQFGARPLRRVIQQRLEDTITEAVLEGRFQEGDTIVADVADGDLKLTHAKPEPQMV